MLQDLSLAEKCIVLGRLHKKFLQDHIEANSGYHGKGRRKSIEHVNNFGTDIGSRVGLSQRYAYELSRWYKLLGEELLLKICRTTQDGRSHLEYLVTLNEYGRANYIKKAVRLRTFKPFDPNATMAIIDRLIAAGDLELA